MVRGSLMIQGTASDVGKSVIVTGLCRYYYRQGIDLVPFKSQNMSLNTYQLEDGSQISISQALQAQAAGLAPSVAMNPILLKPNSDQASEVIFMGQSIGYYQARDYQALKPRLKENLQDVLNQLQTDYDLVLIEGAGSPAEINLNQTDIVNMGLADMADAPVILVADIDRGGVFASIYGTIKLLPEDWQKRIKGIIINKFRGDIKLLEDGFKQIEALTDVPVLGVLPYQRLALPQEDSLMLDHWQTSYPLDDRFDLGLLKLPRIPNLHEFSYFMTLENLSLRRINRARDIGQADLLVLPAVSNLAQAQDFMATTGLVKALEEYLDQGGRMVAFNGSQQLLGRAYDEFREQIQVMDQGQLAESDILDYLNQIACSRDRPLIYQASTRANPFDQIAQLLEEHLDMDQITAIIEKGVE